MRIPFWSRDATYKRRHDSEYAPRLQRENVFERKVIKRNGTEDGAGSETSVTSSAISDQFTSSIPPVNTPQSQAPSSVAPSVDPLSSIQASASTSLASIAEPSTVEIQPVTASFPPSTSSVPPPDAASSQIPSLAVAPSSITQSTSSLGSEITSVAASTSPVLPSNDPPATSQIADPVASVPPSTSVGSDATAGAPSVQPPASVAPSLATTTADASPAVSPTEAAESLGAPTVTSPLDAASATPVRVQSSGSGSQTTISGGSSTLVAGASLTTGSAVADSTRTATDAKATASAAESEQPSSATASGASKDAHGTPLKLSKPSATLLDSLSVPASTTFVTSITAIPVFDSLPTATGAANSGNGNANGQPGVNGGVDVNGSPNGADGSHGITTVAKNGGVKTSVIVSGAVIGVSVLAIIILLIFINRRIFRRHRLGKAESPPSSPGFQVPISPYPDRLARSMNQISMQRELEMGTGTAEGNGFRWDEDVKEFGLGGKEMNEKWDQHSTGSSFKDEQVWEKQSLIGNFKGKLGSLTSMIKR